jgi:hypothetical protein
MQIQWEVVRDPAAPVGTARADAAVGERAKRRVRLPAVRLVSGQEPLDARGSCLGSGRIVVSEL